jgi:protein ImuB
MRSLTPPIVQTESQPHVAPRARAPLRAVQRAAARRTPARELWAGVHLPGMDADRLAHLAARVERFTPRVSLMPPDGLVLEVRGSLHLFAGVAGLTRELTAVCRRFTGQPQLAFAATPLAALVTARAGRPGAVLDAAQLTGQLAPLPLAVLRWPEDTLARLRRMGVVTIGEVLRLPRAGFARRFGTAQLAMLDALTGRAADVRPAFRARPRFRRRQELDCELESHELLLSALAPLLGELGEYLRLRQYGVLELECRLVHRQAPPTPCVMRLAAPCADAQRLQELLGERLSALQLPAPVRACELRAGTLVPYQPQALALWQPGEQGGGAGREASELVERLRARLGPEAVHGLALREEHRPESAWRVSAPPAASPGQRASRPPAAEPGAGRRRPLWLLPAPLRLRARDGLPRRRGPLRLASEPERIETGWWDGGEIARDYYVAVDVHGVRLWVYRERAAPHAWFLHGVFG